MMRRVAGQVLRAALGGRDAGVGRARLAHPLPPVVVVVGLGQGSSVTPRERERWVGALPRRRDARHGEVEGLLRTSTTFVRSRLT